MTPLASYRERVFRGFALQSRNFFLFADRIDVSLKFRGKVTEISFPLSTFRNTAPARGLTRLLIYKRATIAALSSLLVIIVLLLLRNNLSPAALASWDRPLMSVIVSAAVFLAFALLLTYRFKKPVNVAKFLDTDGKVALDILQSGPDAARFEAFVKQMQAQIKAAG